MKTPFQRIVVYNLATLSLLAVALRLLNQGTESGIGFALMMAFLIVGQLFVTVIKALSAALPEERRAYWLSSLLVLLIGYGTCVAGAAIPLQGW